MKSGGKMENQENISNETTVEQTENTEITAQRPTNTPIGVTIGPDEYRYYYKNIK